MDKNLIYFYYKKIEFSSKRNNTYDTFHQNKDKILSFLIQIVDNHLEFLLTDSMIEFICRKTYMTTELYCIVNGKYELINMLMIYFKTICAEYNKEPSKQDIILKLLDNNTKDSTKKAYDFIKVLYDNYNRYHYRLYDIEKIIYIVLSYCLINNKMNEYDTIISKFIDNPYNTLDDLYINDILDPIGVYEQNNNKLIDIYIVSLAILNYYF